MNKKLNRFYLLRYSLQKNDIASSDQGRKHKSNKPKTDIIVTRNFVKKLTFFLKKTVLPRI